MRKSVKSRSAALNWTARKLTVVDYRLQPRVCENTKNLTTKSLNMESDLSDQATTKDLRSSKGSMTFVNSAGTSFHTASAQS